MKHFFLPWFAVMISAGWACKGEVIQLEDAPRGMIDAGLQDLKTLEVSSPGPDAIRYDVTVKAGDPCTFAQCAANLICMANVCRSKCTQGLCNDKAPECEVDERCVWASDFSGACLPATNIYRELCDQEDWLNCNGGTQCVRVDDAPAKCILLCTDSTDCPAGIECLSLNPPNQMCKVCPE